ncbi:MAG: hypothetical protein R3E95_09985 [Thiolinea sp.]
MKRRRLSTAVGTPTADKALWIQISIVASAVIAAVVSISAYVSLNAFREQSLEEVRQRLEGYHQVMAYMVERVDDPELSKLPGSSNRMPGLARSGWLTSNKVV